MGWVSFLKFMENCAELDFTLLVTNSTKCPDLSENVIFPLFQENITKYYQIQEKKNIPSNTGVSSVSDFPLSSLLSSKGTK